MPTKDDTQSEFADAFLSRVHEELAGTDYDKLSNSDWMETFLAHPLIEGASWSFKDHEYQIDIVNSTAPRRSVIKCSQVGLSEISIGIILTILVRVPRVRAIYTMPTKKLSELFMADRFNSAIENSKYVMNMIVPEMNNLSVKKFANGSYLYADGTEGSRSGISVPAPYIFKDEIDFSNQTTLKRLASRQAHWKKEDTINMAFSTPTIPNYGISAEYNKSSKGIYAVKCNSCNTTSPLDFFTDVVVPGFDRPLIEWSASDLLNSRVKVKEAYVKCPNCGKPISADNMSDPTKRMWAHEHPSLQEEHEGFQVQPFDVYTINPPAVTLSQVEDYDSKQEWVNFRVGRPYVDASSRILPPTIIEMSQLQGKFKYYLGADVGKTSWIVLLAVSPYKIVVVHKESLVNELHPETKRSTVAERINELRTQYNIKRIIVDGMPDLTLAATIIDMFRDGFIARYVPNAPEPGTFCKFKDSGEVVIMRSEGFNLLAAKTALSSVYQFEDNQTRLFNTHLGNMAKVIESGRVTWVKTGEDHYAHALLYAMTATGSLAVRTRRGDVQPENVFTAGVSSATLRNKATPFNLIV